MPSILALRRQRQRQEDLCEFQASLVYRVSTRTPRATEKKQNMQRKQARHGVAHAKAGAGGCPDFLL